MQKSKIWLILASVVVGLLVFGLVGFWYQQKNNIKSGESADASAEKVVSILDPINGQVVGEKMAETNPFKVQVNPYEAYKNPFKP